MHMKCVILLTIFLNIVFSANSTKINAVNFTDGSILLSANKPTGTLKSRTKSPTEIRNIVDEPNKFGDYKTCAYLLYAHRNADRGLYVDLLQNVWVDFLRLYFDDNCCNKTHGTFNVYINIKTEYVWCGSGTHDRHIVDIKLCRTIARIVQVVFREDSPKITICELEVYGSNDTTSDRTVLYSANKPTGTLTSRTKSPTEIRNIVDEPNKSGDYKTCAYLFYANTYAPRGLYVNLLQYVWVYFLRLYFDDNCCNKTHGQINVYVDKGLKETEYLLCGSGTRDRHIVDVKLCQESARIVRVFFTDDSPTIAICELEVYVRNDTRNIHPINYNFTFRIFQTNDSIVCMEKNNKTAHSLALLITGRAGYEVCSKCSEIVFPYNLKTVKPGIYYSCIGFTERERHIHRNVVGPIEIRSNPKLLSAKKPTWIGTSTTIIDNFSNALQLVDGGKNTDECIYLKKARTDGHIDIYLDLLQFSELSFVRLYFGDNCCREPFSQFDIKIGMNRTSSKYYATCGSGTQDKRIVEVSCRGRARVVQAIFTVSPQKVAISELEVYGHVGFPIDTDHTFRMFQTEHSIGCKERNNQTVYLMSLYKDDIIVEQCVRCNEVSQKYNIMDEIVDTSFYRCQTFDKGSLNEVGPIQMQKLTLVDLDHVFRIFQSENSIGCEEESGQIVDTINLYKYDKLVKQCKKCSRVSIGYFPEAIMPKTYYRCKTLHKRRIGSVEPTEMRLFSVKSRKYNALNRTGKPILLAAKNLMTYIVAGSNEVTERHKICTYLYMKKNVDRAISVNLLQFAELSFVRLYFDINCCEEPFSKFDVMVGLSYYGRYTKCGSGTRNKRRIDTNCIEYGAFVQVIFFDNAPKIKICDLEVYGFAGIPFDRKHRLRLYQKQNFLGCKDIFSTKLDKMTLYKNDTEVKYCFNCNYIFANYSYTQKVLPGTFYRCESIYNDSKRVEGPFEMEDNQLLLSANKPTGTWRDPADIFGHTYLIVDEPKNKGKPKTCTQLIKNGDDKIDLYVDLLRNTDLTRIRLYFNNDCCETPHYDFVVRIGGPDQGFINCGSGKRDQRIVNMRCFGKARVVQVIFDTAPMVDICELEVYGFAGTPIDTDHTVRAFQTEDTIGCKEMSNRNVNFMRISINRVTIEQCSNCFQVSKTYNKTEKIIPGTFYQCRIVNNGSTLILNTEIQTGKQIFSSKYKPANAETSITDMYKSDINRIIDNPNKVEKTCTQFDVIKGENKIYVDLLNYEKLSRVRLNFDSAPQQTFFVEIGLSLTSNESYSQCGYGTPKKLIVDVGCIGYARIVQVIFLDKRVVICELQVFGFEESTVTNSKDNQILLSSKEHLSSWTNSYIFPKHFPHVEDMHLCIQLITGSGTADINVNLLKTFEVSRVRLYFAANCCKEPHNKFVVKIGLYNKPFSNYECGSGTQDKPIVDVRCFGFARFVEVVFADAAPMVEICNLEVYGYTGIPVDAGIPILLSANKSINTWTSIFAKSPFLSETTHTCVYLNQTRRDTNRDIYVDLLQISQLSFVRLYFRRFTRYAFVVKIGLSPTSNKSYSECGSSTHDEGTVGVNCVGYARVVQIIFIDKMIYTIDVCNLEIYGFAETPDNGPKSTDTNAVNYNTAKSTDNNEVNYNTDVYKLLSAGKPTGTWRDPANFFSYTNLTVDEPGKTDKHTTCTRLVKKGYDKINIYVDLLQYAILSRVRLYFADNCCEAPHYNFFVKSGDPMNSNFTCGSGTQDKPIVDVMCVGNGRVVQVVFSNLAPMVDICELEVFGSTVRLVDTEHKIRMFQTEDTIGCKEMHRYIVESMVLVMNGKHVDECNNCHHIFKIYSSPAKIVPGSFYQCYVSHKGHMLLAAGPIEMLTDNPILFSVNYKPTTRWTSITEYYSDIYRILEDPYHVDDSCRLLNDNYMYVDILRHAKLSRVRFYFDSVLEKIYFEIGLSLALNESFNKCGSGSTETRIVDVNCVGFAKIVQVIFYDDRIAICELEVYGFAKSTDPDADTYYTGIPILLSENKPIKTWTSLFVNPHLMDDTKNKCLFLKKTRDGIDRDIYIDLLHNAFLSYVRMYFLKPINFKFVVKIGYYPISKESYSECGSGTRTGTLVGVSCVGYARVVQVILYENVTNSIDICNLKVYGFAVVRVDTE